MFVSARYLYRLLIAGLLVFGVMLKPVIAFEFGCLFGISVCVSVCMCVCLRVRIRFGVWVFVFVCVFACAYWRRGWCSVCTSPFLIAGLLALGSRPLA